VLPHRQFATYRPRPIIVKLPADVLITINGRSFARPILLPAVHFALAAPTPGKGVHLILKINATICILYCKDD
jgi:hypothetical protein